MRRRILLVNPNRAATPYPVFPLGMACVGRALRDAGHAVRYCDSACPDGGLPDAIRAFGPEYIGLSIRNIDDTQIVNTKFLAAEAIETARAIRAASSSPMILGGSGFSLFPGRLLDEIGADYGIAGEGEAAIVALIAALEAGKPPTGIGGLVYRANGHAIENPPASYVGMVAPDRDAGLAQRYLLSSSMLNIQTQRGCPFTCCYCSYPVIEGRARRLFPADKVADDIERAVALGAKYLFIVDSVFNTSADHVAGICEEIMRRGIAIGWGCFLRPQGLTADLMHLMARAGLKHIEFGSDHLCDEVLAAYGKQFAFDDVFRSSELARAEKIHYAHFLILGGPGENENTLKRAYENSRRLRKTVFFPFIGMRILPHTDLLQRARTEGFVDDTTDLLRPTFYISTEITAGRISSLVAGFSRGSRNWVVGDPTPQMMAVTAQLRALGVVGPLWEYLAA